MSIIHAKQYLKELRDDIECDGDEKSPILCQGLVYILDRFLEALEK